jgi:hypothetical protein
MSLARVRFFIGLGTAIAVIFVATLYFVRNAQPGAVTGLHDLRGVDQLAAAFNRDTGKPRVVLLLSPT